MKNVVVKGPAARKDSAECVRAAFASAKVPRFNQSEYGATVNLEPQN